ncbi:DUF1638 domain-containing protein [Thermodesulfobacteriota bacterium]
MKRKATIIVACSTVINEMSPLLPPGIEYKEMEPGLHLRPDKLRGALQDIIDEISAHTETIILGYGLCSMAAIGLKASHSTLIIPRVDDCIAMFLGSQKLYKHHLKKEPGTYFLSKGWIDAGVTLTEEFKQTEARLGKRAAKKIKKRMLQNYTRLAYIDMEQKDQKRYRERARQAAEELDLKYEEIKGTTGLIRKIINGPWDDEFVIAPPGHIVSLDDFKIK